MKTESKTCCEIDGDMYGLSAKLLWEKPILKDYGSVGYITHGDLAGSIVETGGVGSYVAP